MCPNAVSIAYIELEYWGVRLLKEMLVKCRQGKLEKKLKSEITITVLIFLMGTTLGVLSKLLDIVFVNEAIRWHRVFGLLDLRNVFSRLSVWALMALVIAVFSKRPLRASINVFGFFVGMLTGYYLTTIFVAGFFPQTYMIAWGIITLLTPIPAFFSWYSKGHGWLAIILSSIIIGFFFTQAFSFGRWYVDISNYDGIICFLLSIALLYRDKKQLLFSLIGALIIAPLIKTCLPYIFGGL